MAWFDLHDEDDDNGLKELLRLSRMYYREAIRCEDSKAYIAGCAMAGAALEGLLLAMVHIYGDEVEAAGLVPKSKNQPKKLLDWKFSELLRAAAGMQWLPVVIQPEEKWSVRRAKIGDYAKHLMWMRNLVHPARYFQDHSPSRVTSNNLSNSIEILEVAHEHLRAKVNESLARKMERMDTIED